MVLAAAAAAALAAGQAGCGGGKTAGSSEELSRLAEERVFDFGSPVDFAGAELTFESWESLQSIGADGGGGVLYAPLKGRYVAVYFTLKGGEGAPGAALDPELFKLRDLDGKIYSMGREICEGPAEWLSLDRGRSLLWTLRWDYQVEAGTLALFDVPYAAQGLTLLVEVPPGGGNPSERIALPLEK